VDVTQQHRPVCNVVSSNAGGDVHLIADTERIPVNANPAELMNGEPDHTVAHPFIRSDEELNVRTTPFDALDLTSERKARTAFHLRRMVRVSHVCDTERQG
jgi:hypothetical protein